MPDYKLELFVSKEEVENEIHVFSWTRGLRLGVRYPQRAVGRRDSEPRASHFAILHGK